MEGFREDLKKAVDNINSDTDFAEQSTKFDEESTAIMNKYAPEVSRKQKVDEPAWLDVEYKRNRALRRKYERIWRRSKTDENMTIYIQQKKLCTDMALEKQTSYYSKLIGDAGSLSEITIQGCESIAG